MSVRVGTLSGSVPQDDDVVTPPVALSDTEQGIPFRLKAGSVGVTGPECAPGVPGESVPGESGPPDAPLAELLSCA